MNTVTKITHKNTEDIDRTATYDVFHIVNLHTGAFYQTAIVGGDVLAAMYARSSQPRRIEARLAR
jgi:hypothetical protein